MKLFNENMKIVTWNINGIRTFKGGIKKALDLFDADIVCFQETKVTRDLLDERTAIVDGYNSYFSFSRGRSGYSGVATFCKDGAMPVAAEEGLTGLLTNHSNAVGCYGDQGDFSTEELQMLDNEGRAVITQHRVMCDHQEKTLTVMNVYCPRADPEKPERKLFKLQFYRLLQTRAEAILQAGGHVIVLGDVNTSHKPIDHCDPDDIENFEDNPSRKWLNNFLFEKNEREELEESGSASPGSGGGKFVDVFRCFHPGRQNAFTCWSTLTGARQTNYGTRIDYILADQSLAEGHFLSADIMPEVEGSDHCPVQGSLRCALLAGHRAPPLCTRLMPEFAGRQQKLSRFLVRVEPRGPQASVETLPGSQELGEIRENIQPSGAGNATRTTAGRKRASVEDGAPGGKRSKVGRDGGPPQGNLLAFFKPKPRGPEQEGRAMLSQEVPERSGGNGGVPEGVAWPNREESQCNITGGGLVEENGLPGDRAVSEDGAKGSEGGAQGSLDRARGTEGRAQESEGGARVFWKTVLRGLPPAPLCSVHQEPCVLRTVRKAGPNLGRQFFVCARPQGHTSNPQARCNFFSWVDKGKS
ncbi:hypothetical protein AGOR_G00151450 [Albula goreensis]|uniref:DNA-(apurinic or apyrimidinic site) endonuclease n=1 Tax=Albula goreensis TaxID=1534307 RepID=A0A8T3D2H6_9TELE|nr:hypothetical protein AGOR_G00151450 [Albula goreensis]